MAKRKQSPSFPVTDLVRWGIVVVIILVVGVLAYLALSSFLRHARLFSVREVTFDQALGDVTLSDLDKMKGHNIFVVDLAKVEDKIRTKYPQLGGLKVLRRFPDEIHVSGYRRDPGGIAVLGAKLLVVSTDGFLTGSPSADQLGSLPKIKGLTSTKASSGERVGDEKLDFAFDVIGAIKRDPELSSLLFKGIDVGESDRIVCAFSQSKAVFDVLVEQSRALEQLRMLSSIVGRTDIDLAEVKYVDLRFNEPLVGKKRTRK